MKKLLLTLLLAFTHLFVKSQSRDSLSDYFLKEDMFENEKWYSSNFVSPTVSFIRVIKNNKIVTKYVSITVSANTLNYNCHGIYVLFENGQKISRPNDKVKIEYDNGFYCTAFFTPTASEIKLLQSIPIKAVRLYIYDSLIDATKYGDIQERIEIMRAAKILLK